MSSEERPSLLFSGSAKELLKAYGVQAPLRAEQSSLAVSQQARLALEEEKIERLCSDPGCKDESCDGARHRSVSLCSDPSCRDETCDGLRHRAASCPSCILASMVGKAAKCNAYKATTQPPPKVLVAEATECAVCEEVAPLCGCEQVSIVYSIGRRICCFEEENDIRDALRELSYVTKVTVEKQRCVVSVAVEDGALISAMEAALLAALNDTAEMAATLVERRTLANSVVEKAPPLCCGICQVEPCACPSLEFALDDVDEAAIRGAVSQIQGAKWTDGRTPILTVSVAQSDYTTETAQRLLEALNKQSKARLIVRDAEGFEIKSLVEKPTEPPGRRREDNKVRAPPPEVTVVESVVVEEEEAAAGKPVEKIVRSRIRVSNMCCEMESTLIKQKLTPVEGVEKIAVNVVGRVAFVTHDVSRVTGVELCRLLNEVHLGASIEAADADEAMVPETPKAQELLFGLGLVLAFVGGTAGLLFSAAKGHAVYEGILLAATAVGSVAVGRKAAKSVCVQRRLDVNCLMLVAVAGALALGDYVESAAVVVVFVLAEFVEGDCLRRVRNSLREVGKSDADEKYATKASDGSRVETKLLEVGDVVCCRAGERVGVDGVVTKGKASVDESALTGEAMPVEKRKGSNMSSGTFLTNGYLELKLTKPPSESSTSLLRLLVEEAQASTSRTQEVVTQFASFFTPTAVLTAALLILVPVVFFQRNQEVWIERALVLLVLACPCALVLAAPIATVSAIGSAAKRGVLIKSAATLEALAAGDTLATDKTGTLTQGRCRVVSRRDITPKNSDEALRLAASLETRSVHPLAAAIVNFAVGCVGELNNEDSMLLSESKVTNFRVVEGSGILGIVDGREVEVGNAAFAGVSKLVEAECAREGTTTIFVAIDGTPSLALNIADPIREEAALALRVLHKRGYELAMLTGDQPATALAVARELDPKGDFDMAVHAALTPAQKLKWVTEAQTDRGRHVLMIGDGVNDAPALAAASVGVAMGAGGSAMAVNAADLAIMSDNLDRLPETVRLAKFSTKVIKQNIVLSVVIKLAVIVLAFTLGVKLWMAVLADLGSLLIVVANGTRPLHFFAPIVAAKVEEDLGGEEEKGDVAALLPPTDENV